jgi:hypothetical protein
VTLPGVTIAALRHRQAEQEEEHRWAATRWRNDWNLVFTTRDGKPLDERNVLRRFHGKKSSP